MAVPDWQVTATSIYCDAVDDDVTLLVYKDWSTRCTGYKRYVENIRKEVAKELKKRGKGLGRELKCEGLGCSRLVGYKDRLFAEEEAKARR
jgi:hypothetical protein